MTVSYRWAGVTDTGKTRTENQDSVYPQGLGAGSSGVIAVADGLGGHPGGDIASECAVEAVADAPPGTEGPELVGAAHDRIIARIAEALGERPELIAMATTLTLAVLSPDAPIEVAHVGDSRAYIANGSKIVQVTEDHTHGMDRVQAGEMSLEEAQKDPDWHVMSNWLGFESYRVATYRVPVEPGDRFLVCTDGLTNMLDDDQIAEILAIGTVERSAAALVDAANDAGGADNITVVVVEALEPEIAAPKEPARRHVQMRNERSKTSGRTMSASLDSDNNLAVSGDSYHPDPMPGSDLGDHEWRYKIMTDDLPELIGLLGGNTGDDIIKIIAERFTGPEADEFERVLVNSGIEKAGYWCWP